MESTDEFFSAITYGLILTFCKGKKVHLYGSKDVISSLCEKGFSNSSDVDMTDVLICTNVSLGIDSILEEIRKFLIGQCRYFYIFIKSDNLYTKSQEAYNFRSFLIENNNNIIDSIILLPHNRCKDKQSYSLILFDKYRIKNNKIFINLINKHNIDYNYIINMYKNESFNDLEEWISNNFGIDNNIDGQFCVKDYRELNNSKKSLSPANYCYTKEQKIACDKLKNMNTIPLKKIVNIIRPCILNSTYKHKNIKVLIMPLCENDGYFNDANSCLEFYQDTIDEEKTVKSDDIIIQYRGTPGNILISGNFSEKDKNVYVIPSSSSIILRRKQESKFSYNQKVLYMYLKSPLCQKYISTKEVCCSNPRRITIDELNNIPVPILSNIECEQYVKSFDKIEQLKQDINNLKKSLDAEYNKIWNLNE